MNDRIEYLIRKLERGKVISKLYEAIIGCDEDNEGCDVCLGIRYAIGRIERME